jgi:hypothetical protein
MRIKIYNPKNIYELLFLLVALPLLLVFIVVLLAFGVLIAVLCMPPLIGIGIYYLIKKLFTIKL